MVQKDTYDFKTKRQYRKELRDKNGKI